MLSGEEPTKLMVVTSELSKHYMTKLLGPDWYVCTVGAMIGGRRFDEVIVVNLGQVFAGTMGSVLVTGLLQWVTDIIIPKLTPGGKVFYL